jgi:hypothetical protein
MMNSGIKGVLGFNAHLPLGASDAFFEDMYETKLKPFFQTLYQFSNIPAALHFSGSFLYKIDRIHSELSSLVNKLVARKQVEMVGGGFYEPMMPLLSHHERMGQIELLTTYLRKSFNKRVTGAYIPDIAWEQSIAYSLSTVDMLYTFVDEQRFIDAGLTMDDYKTPCVAESKGGLVTVLTVYSRIAEELQKHDAQEVFDNLVRNSKRGTHVWTIFPDFFTPATSLNITTEDYLQRFFEAVANTAGKIEWTLPSKIVKNSASPHPVYFRDRAAKKYLIENPEAASVYAKMVWVRGLIEQLKGDKERKQSAQEELWKAQGYSLFSYDDDFEFFHRSVKDGGHIAGINNAALRDAVYSSMLLAEQITRGKGNWKASLTVCDFNFDGINEYLFQNEVMNCYAHLRGASLFELDFFPKTWNYLSTIKAAALPEQSFFDVIAPPACDIKDIMRDPGTEQNPALRICGNELYKCLDMDRVEETASFLLAGANCVFGDIEIQKDYKLESNIVTVRYRLRNNGKEPLDFQFVTFIGFSFPDSETNLRIFSYGSYESFSNNSEKNAVANEEARLGGIEAIDFQDLRNELIINVASDCRFNAVIEPVHARYRSITKEVINCYQSTRVSAHRPISLVPGGETAFTFRLGIFY